METNLSEGSSTVRFIDNKLPHMHPFFDAPTHFDSKSQQYVANSQSLQSTRLLSMPRPPPRPEWTDLRALDFWNSMYPVAIGTFRLTNDAHKKCDEYSLHTATDWDDVYAILERAREKYQNRGGKVGWFQRVRRKAADNVATVQNVTTIASKVVPDNPYSTPVLGAVGMMLDAVKQTSKVRKEVEDVFDGEGFGNLIPIFSDVELFLGQMFNNDQNIYSASLDLAVAALKAIDRTVRFYTSNPLRQAGKAFLSGTDYERDLIESLKDLNAKSKKLGDQAYKSHMRESQLYSEYGRQMMGDLRETMLLGFNGIYHFLQEHAKRQDEKLEKVLAHLRVDIETDRLRSPSPVPSVLQLPALPAPVWIPLPVLPPLMSQAELEMMVGMLPIEQEDMDYILVNENEFPPRQRLQAEQIIQQQIFRDWIVPADSSSLLVQWEAPSPRMYADLSPLSVFCTKMVQALRVNDRFMSVQWFCGRHLRGNTNGSMGHSMVLSLIAQLLRGRPGGFDMHALTQRFDLPSLFQSQDIKGLTDLLDWLVRGLPGNVTLFCLIDGVVFCERDEHFATAAPVLLCLLGLTSDPTIPVTVKILFASAPGSAQVHGLFENEGLIINVETLPHLSMAPCDERMVRELGEGLDS